MTVTEKRTVLLEGLLGATRRREIQWEQALEPGTYRVSLPHGTVYVEEVAEEGTPPRVQILVLSKEARVVDQFSPPGARQKEQVGELYTLARESARGGDHVLDLIIGDLGNTCNKARAPSGGG